MYGTSVESTDWWSLNSHAHTRSTLHTANVARTNQYNSERLYQFPGKTLALCCRQYRVSTSLSACRTLLLYAPWQLMVARSLTHSHTRIAAPHHRINFLHFITIIMAKAHKHPTYQPRETTATGRCSGGCQFYNVYRLQWRLSRTSSLVLGRCYDVVSMAHTHTQSKAT